MCYSYYEVEFLEGNDPIQVLRNLIIPPKTVYKKIRKILQENTLCFMLNTHTHTHTHTHTKAAVILFGQGFSHVSLEPAELKKYFVTVHPENTCEK